MWDLPSTGSSSPTGRTATPANVPNGVHLVLRRSAYFNSALCRRLRFFADVSVAEDVNSLSTWAASTGLASSTASRMASPDHSRAMASTSPHSVGSSG
jgi:hypothetical protein